MTNCKVYSHRDNSISIVRHADVGQANQRTSGNERRLFITVLSSTHHDNLCLGLEKLVSHVLAKTPGDTYIWSVNNSAEAHVSSRCGGLLKSANVVFEALGEMILQLYTL